MIDSEERSDEEFGAGLPQVSVNPLPQTPRGVYPELSRGARGDTLRAAFGARPEGGNWGDFQEAGLESLDLVGLLEMSEEEFRRRFRGTPVLRAKRAGLQRNACVALGNRRDPVAVSFLRRALLGGDSLVRGHAAWALGQTGTGQARRALELFQEIVTALKVLRGAVAAAAE